jgi:ABC-type branched-subunit amino acid transport system ATPase component
MIGFHLQTTKLDVSHVSKVSLDAKRSLAALFEPVKNVLMVHQNIKSLARCRTTKIYQLDEPFILCNMQLKVVLLSIIAVSTNCKVNILGCMNEHNISGIQVIMHNIKVLNQPANIVHDLFHNVQKHFWLIQHILG